MQTTYSHNWNQYELIDAGNGKKLERWFDVVSKIEEQKNQ